jgi:TonB family protein
VALHAALALLILSGRPAPSAPARQVVPIDVELRFVPPLPVAPVEAPSPPPRRRVEGPRTASAAAPAPIAEPAPDVAPDAAPGPPVDARREALALLGASPDGAAAGGLHGESGASGEASGGPDLRPRWPGPLAGGAAGEEGGDASAAAAVQAVVGAWAREEAGKARAAYGLVHPYYREAGQAFLAAWDVERTIASRGLSGYLAQAGENLRAFAGFWQEAAGSYGKTGAPAFLDGGSPRMRELSGLPSGAVQDALVSLEIARQVRAALSKRRVATVRVTQGPDGRLRDVRLVAPSQDAGVDAAALAAVRRAVAGLPAPPDDVREAGRELVSLWEFELEVSISPPIPVIAFEFDEVMGLTDVRLPLDRRLWKRVRLVAVH